MIMQRNLTIHTLVEQLYSSTEWNFNYDTQTVKLLFSTATDDIKKAYGGALLAIAALYRSAEMIQILKLNVNSFNGTDDASTGMMISAANNNIDAVKFLLKVGANVNFKNPNGDMALHIAAFNGNLEIVQHLIKAGADVNLRDKNGFSPLDCTLTGFCHFTKQTLFAQRNSRYLDIAKFLIDSKADVHALDHNNRTLIQDIVTSQEQLTKLLQDPSLETMTAHQKQTTCNGIKATITMLDAFKDIVTKNDVAMNFAHQASGHSEQMSA